MGGHGADGDGATIFLDARQTWDLAEVDDVLGLGQTQLHHRDETVAAGQNLGVLQLAEQTERFLHRRGAVVLERGWIHEVGSYLPAWAA